MLVNLFLRGKLNHLTRLVVCTRKRTQETKCNRLVRNQLNVFAIDLDGVTLFRAAWYKADCGIIAQPDVVSAR